MITLQEIIAKAGEVAALILPKRTQCKIENAIDILDDGLVDACVVCDELHISKKTLGDYVYSGKITPDMYVTSPVNGVRKYYYNKIIGKK